MQTYIHSCLAYMFRSLYKLTLYKNCATLTISHIHGTKNVNITICFLERKNDIGYVYYLTGGTTTCRTRSAEVSLTAVVEVIKIGFRLI